MKTSIIYLTVLFIFSALFSACSDNISGLTEQSSASNHSATKPNQPTLFWESKGFTINAHGEEFIFDEIRSQTYLLGLNHVQVKFSTRDYTEPDGYKYDIAILGDVNAVSKISNNGQTYNIYDMTINLENSSMIRIYASLTKTNFCFNPAAFLTIENVQVFRLD